MLPIRDFELMENIKIIKRPSETFKVDFEKNRIKGVFNNIEALKQSIYKILMTKRYAYEIYDWNYGIEIEGLIGMPKEYIKTELERRIIDALSIDDRIEKVYDFEFFDIVNDKFALEVKFLIKSIFGQIDINWEVETNV